MRRRVNLRIAAVCGVAFVASLMFVSTNTAQARPKYKSVINDVYPELAKKHGTDGKLSCAACHPTKVSVPSNKAKTKRNNYGIALTKHLGSKNVMDIEKIKEALKKTEADKSHVEGKTFGDLIKANEMPGEDKEVE